MSVASIQALQQTTASSEAPAKTGTLRDEFMRLFVAQLQHQDPLQPQDNNAFVAQLAQMSQVEQATEANTRLQAIADQQASAARASLSALVGHQVTAQTDSIEIGRSGSPPAMSVHLEGTAAKLKVSVVDGAGRQVRALDLGAHGAGDVSLDARTLAGLAPGAYQIKVEATAAGGAAVPATTQITGVIDAMQLDGAGGKFRIGSVAVPPAAIISVGSTGTNPSIPNA